MASERRGGRDAAAEHVRQASDGNSYTETELLYQRFTTSPGASSAADVAEPAAEPRAPGASDADRDAADAAGPLCAAGVPSGGLRGPMVQLITLGIG